MIYVVKLTDADARVLSAIIDLGLQATDGCTIPLGAEAKLALDRFAAQVGQNPQWHKTDDPQLRPRGE